MGGNRIVAARTDRTETHVGTHTHTRTSKHLWGDKLSQPAPLKERKKKEKKTELGISRLVGRSRLRGFFGLAIGFSTCSLGHGFRKSARGTNSIIPVLSAFVLSVNGPSFSVSKFTMRAECRFNVQMIKFLISRFVFLGLFWQTMSLSHFFLLLPALGALAKNQSRGPWSVQSLHSRDTSKKDASAVCGKSTSRRAEFDDLGVLP